VTSDVVLYGLRIRSEVSLPQARPAEARGVPDLEIVVGPSIEPTMTRPDGELIAEDELSETEWYHFVRLTNGGFHLRYASACDFQVSADLRRVTIYPVKGVDPDRLSVFTSGGLPAFVLMMRGELVLHASAVDVGDRAVAFAGFSGMGKSTLATLCCSQGARLVTDDVLRLDLADGVRCYLGANELRLRRASTELAAGFGVLPSLRPTGDGRQALTPQSATSELLPLAAIVIPVADRAVTTLVLRRLEPIQAMLALLSLPRLPGWADPASQATQMQQLGRLVEQVEVYAGRVPWGPPFPPDLIDTILTAVGIDHSGRSA
jgi:hypothetical protein